MHRFDTGRHLVPNAHAQSISHDFHRAVAVGCRFSDTACMPRCVFADQRPAVAARSQYRV